MKLRYFLLPLCAGLFILPGCGEYTYKFEPQVVKIAQGTDSVSFSIFDHFIWDTDSGNEHGHYLVKADENFSEESAKLLTSGLDFDRSVRVFFFNEIDRLEDHPKYVFSTTDRDSLLTAIENKQPLATTFTISLEGEKRPIVYNQGFSGLE